MGPANEVKDWLFSTLARNIYSCWLSKTCFQCTHFFMISCNNMCTKEDFQIFIFYYCKLCSLCVTCHMTCTSRAQAGSSVFSDAKVYFRWPILAFFPPERQREREIRRYDSSSFSKFTNVMFVEVDIWCFGYEKHKITTFKQRSIKHKIIGESLMPRTLFERNTHLMWVREDHLE